MIEVICPRCQSRMEAPDEYAGQLVQCGNCEASLTVPNPQAETPVAAAAPAPATPVAAQPVAAAATPAGQPGPTQIIVNVAGAAPQSDMVHKQVNMFVAWLLFLFLNGTQYMYMGQIGKGGVVLLLDLSILFFSLVFGGLTCGVGFLIGMIIYLPWRILCLVDTLVIASRLKKGPISSWRCF